MSGLFSGLQTNAKLLACKLSTNEVTKKVGLYLFDDDITGSNTHSLNNITSLTFNEDTHEQIIKLLKEGLHPSDVSYPTIEKTLGKKYRFIAIVMFFMHCYVVLFSLITSH